MFAINILLYIITTAVSCYTIPHFTKLPPTYLYPFDGDTVSIVCNVNCNNCSDQLIILWYKDDDIIKSQVENQVESTNRLFTIKSFNSSNDEGKYHCSVQYYGVVIRSINTYIYHAELPSFALVDTFTFINGDVVLKCVDNFKAAPHRIKFKWLKDGEIIENSSQIFILDELLYINKIQERNGGIYSCEYKLQARNVWVKSKEVNVSVSQGVFTLPRISYTTESQNVFFNDSISVSCLTSGSPNTTVRLFKVLQGGDIEQKILEQKVYAVLIIERFSEIQAGVYVCEAELDSIRTRKEINLELAPKPDLSHDGMMHVNTVTGGRLSLSCDYKSAHDAATTWYFNGSEVKQNPNVIIKDSSMRLKLITLKQTGVYQCIVENKYGSDMKMFYLTVDDSGLAPMTLKIIKLSPTSVNLTWTSIQDLAEKPRTLFCTVYWTDPNGLTREELTLKSELVLKNKFFGGLEYQFEVCVMSTLNSDIKNCIITKEKMLEDKPIISPDFSRPEMFSNIALLKWGAIPETYAMSVIKNYTVYMKLVYGDSIGQIFQYHFNASTSSAEIPIPANGVYKVWMVGTNRIGHSPSSEMHIISTDNLINDDSTDLQFSVRWQMIISLHGDYRPLIEWEVLKENQNLTLHQFRIFYVEFPYTDYWKSVKTITVDKSVNHYSVEKLSPKKTYRFTIAPIYKQKALYEMVRYIYSYGKRTHVILSEDKNFRKSFLRHANGFNDYVNSPVVSCFGMSEHSLLISWNKPITDLQIQNYIVYITEERTNKEILYLVEDTHLLLHNLTFVWYAVRVQANNDTLKRTVTFYESDSVACHTKIDVPTKPLNVSYDVLYNGRLLYLNVKWKPPVYQGDSLYSYVIRKKEMAAEERDFIVNYIFDYSYYHVLMDTQHKNDDGWIYSQAISIKKPRLKFDIQVTPVNDKGEGEISKITTEGVYRPRLQTDLLADTTPATKSNYSHQITLGVIVGIAVSAIFFIVFIIMCLWKYPCKKNTAQSLISSTPATDDDEDATSYLYLTRLNETQSKQDTSSTEMTYSTVCNSSTSRSRRGDSCYGKYKILLPFGRRGRAHSIKQDTISSKSSTCTTSCTCDQRNSRNTNSQLDRGPLCCTTHCHTVSFGSSASENKD